MLIEKLNQRLQDAPKDDNVPEKGEDEIDEIPNQVSDKEAYPIDFGPLLKSLNKIFGKDAFLRPEKENDEVLCVYFDPEVFQEKQEEFTLEKMQEWLLDKGFTIVSRMPSGSVVKVYFTSNRLIDDNDEKGEKGEYYNKKNFGKVGTSGNPKADDKAK